MTHSQLPNSIAIAGSWGYIGRKFLAAAVTLGIDALVFDPGPVPDDVNDSMFRRIDDPQAFYDLPVDFYHLAVHPEDRTAAIAALFDRSRGTPAMILNEKPMTSPESPEACRQLIAATDRAQARMLFDFPELFDDMTTRICHFLTSHQDVKIREMVLHRSKDRESPENPRNYKRMVPIQYQESVHCIAYAVYLLAQLNESPQHVLDCGMTATAESERYNPPNPGAYRYAVDGRCEYELTLGDVVIKGLTNFKSGAPWSKERIIRGTADGEEFSLEVDYLEGRKRLAINGVEQACDSAADSYQQVIRTAWRWLHETDSIDLMTGVFPNPRFAHLAYQLSSILWRCSQDEHPIRLASSADVLAFDARFAPR